MNNADRSTLLDVLQAAVQEADKREQEARRLLREAWDAGIKDSDVAKAIGWTAARVRMRHRREDSLA